MSQVTSVPTCERSNLGDRLTFACLAGPPDTDCLLGPWSSFTTCTEDCDGQRVRYRNVVIPRDNDGDECGDLLDFDVCGDNCGAQQSSCVQPRLPLSSHTRVPHTLSADPQACQVSQWSAWSSCSEPCDGGTRGRTRSVTGGDTNDCPVLSQSEDCNTHACGTFPPSSAMPPRCLTPHTVAPTPQTHL